ncbi:protein FAM214A isoform X2 [Harmonia axyridis]|uniref:protein FAM214A isoform X2 n=1 Tax=Harmonia axyridis TaxID=115357 RepID=UPI001E2793F2|nr:protein FAM214A isoform X2 [Harmonia axyridis]
MDMHSTSLMTEPKGEENEEDVLLSVTSLVTEGRIPEKLGPKSRGFREGPHCCLTKKTQTHTCNASDSLCANFEFFREEILKIWAQNLPVTVEVLLTCGCQEGEYSVGPEVEDNCILLESWTFNIMNKRNSAPPSFQLAQLISAIRSQLYFSQITAWLSTPNENTKRLTSKHLRYRVAQPGDNSKTTRFRMNPVEHNFPTVEIGCGAVLQVSFFSMPRMSAFPIVQCRSCKPMQETIIDGGPGASTREKIKKTVANDRIPYPLKGKHHCDDNDRPENEIQPEHKAKFKRLRQNLREDQASTSTINNHINTVRQTKNTKESRFGLIDTNRAAEVEEEAAEPLLIEDEEDRNVSLLEAIERVALRTPEKTRKETRGFYGGKTEQLDGSVERKQRLTCTKSRSFDCECDSNDCDICRSDNGRSKLGRNGVPFLDRLKGPSSSDGLAGRLKERGSTVPSINDKTTFKKALDSASSMVFHKSGLPLMSSPAPVRRGKTCFDFDSSIGSVKDIKSAFLSSSFSTDDDSESDGSQMSPCSPETAYLAQKTIIEEEKEERVSVRCVRRRKGQACNLLGSFEESVLNGRLEPVSTVQGFTAELGASGSFVPKHLKVPVTVFFYSVGDHERMSSPYLCHIKLEKKGYCVPKVGTFQVTLKNPLGMVVKMFVVLYDLSDMPPNSKTFMRQRILFLPTDCKDENVQRTSKWLKYLIHLRFASSKSGKIYLHGDIRIIVLNKADLDTASAHDIGTKYEMRTITMMPINPRFSFRK